MNVITATRTEDLLVSRLLDTVLREDLWQWRTRGVLVAHDAGPLLFAPSHDLAVRVRKGVVSDWTVRAPEVLCAGEPVTGLDPVLDALSLLVDPEDLDGFATWREECTAALDAELARPRQWAHAQERVRSRSTADCYERALVDEAAAAHLGHPVYPTGSARMGLSETENHAYGPESLPSFPLRWLDVDRAAVSGTLLEHALPTWWPAGTTTRFALPAHPLMADWVDHPAVRPLRDAPDIRVTPTLSMRTVSVDADPASNIKLPVPTATLGARNRRLVSPGSLIDGAAAERLLRRLLVGSRWSERILHADEQVYGGLEGRADASILLRRNPPLPPAARIVSVAALPARSLRTGRAVICELAAHVEVSVTDLLSEACALIFGFAVWLYGHGIALEAHQQNLSLIAEPGRPLRLLLKDNDGLRVFSRRIGANLTDPQGSFEDARIFVDSPEPLQKVLSTITVHLVAGMLAFSLADAGAGETAVLLDIVSTEFADAVERADAEIRDELRCGIIEARRWPAKAMVTAGTLLSKERSGAQDINKHYVDAPNYLFRP